MPLKQTTGSRAQVMHGTAKKTSGGLTKKQLKYNKQGKIVSKKASALAKKNNRLVKAGYITRKGEFGVSMRGGASTKITCNYPDEDRETEQTIDIDFPTTLRKIIPLINKEIDNYFCKRIKFEDKDEDNFNSKLDNKLENNLSNITAECYEKNITLDNSLLDASEEGNLEEVRRLLSEGADVNAVDKYKNTPLHFASAIGDEAVKMLLDAGADVTAGDNYKWTPLHLASYNGDEAAVKMLLDAGASPNSKNNYEETPLHFATRAGDEAAVKICCKM